MLERIPYMKPPKVCHTKRCLSAPSRLPFFTARTIAFTCWFWRLGLDDLKNPPPVRWPPTMGLITDKHRKGWTKTCHHWAGHLCGVKSSWNLKKLIKHGLLKKIPGVPGHGPTVVFPVMKKYWGATWNEQIWKMTSFNSVHLGNSNEKGSTFGFAGFRVLGAWGSQHFFGGNTAKKTRKNHRERYIYIYTNVYIVT